MAEWVEKGSIKGPPGEIPDVSDFLRDGDVSSAISGSAEKVASDKAVKDYVDAQVSAEATSRQEQDSSLQTQIGGKANVEHSHEMDDVTGLNDKISEIETSVSGKANATHTHTTSQVDGLDTKLSGIDDDIAAKADKVHKHAIADVTDLQTTLDGKAAKSHEHSADNITSGTLSIDRIPNIPDAKIDGMSATKLTGTVPQANLPSYVDDVIEAENYAALPPTGEAGKIYVDKETNKTYRWGGSAYVEISASLALGETSSTAFRGDYGKVAYDHAQAKGSEFATGLYKISTNAEGHVISATAVTKGDITVLGIPAQDTTYVDATTSASGLMSAADKTKLNGIANGANNYTHPTSDAGALGSNIYKITTDADGHIIAATPIAKGDITALGIPSEDTDTTYTAGSGLVLSGTEFGIADGGVIGRHLDDNCVMERNIAVGAVTSDKIPALAITTPKLVDNAVTAMKMADDAVATRSIQDKAVTADKIADGVIPESVSYDVATSEADGLMSSEDKTALDNLKTNAVTTDASGYVQKSPFKFKNSDSSVEMNFTSKTETSLDLEFRTTTGTDVVTISADNLFGEASGGIAMGTGATFDMGEKSVNGIVDAVGEGADGTKLVTDKAVKDAIAAIEIPDPLPSGGTDGQVLTKTADGEAWEDIPDYENATTEYDGLMSAADKTKLDGIQAGANNYTHPASAAGAKASGLYNVQTDAQGHVIAAVNVVKDDITALGIPAQDTTYVDATTGASGLMSAADKTKLDGMDTALAGKSDVGHTHEIANVNGLQTALDGKAASGHKHDASDITTGTMSVDRLPSITDDKISSVSAEKITGTIPSDNLPSYVDDVIEVENYAALPPTGEAGKIYVDKQTNKTYRWGGSDYVEISASLALGSTSSTAFRGDYGEAAYNHAVTNKGSEFASGLYKITTNAEGHVTAATSVVKGDITALGIPAQDTTYVDATTGASGLMSAADKTKLDGITEGADKLPDGGTTGQVLTKTADGEAWADVPAQDISDVPRLDSGKMKSLHQLGITDLNNVTEPGTYVGASGLGGYPTISNLPDEFMEIQSAGIPVFYIDVYRFDTPDDMGLDANYLIQKLYPMYGSGVGKAYIRRGTIASGAQWDVWFGIGVPQVVGNSEVGYVLQVTDDYGNIGWRQASEPDMTGVVKLNDSFLMNGESPVSSVTLVDSASSMSNYVNIDTSSDGAAVGLVSGSKIAGFTSTSAGVSLQLDTKTVTSITDDASTGDTNALATAKAVKDYVDSKTVPQASATQYGTVKFASDEDFKAYMNIS